MVATDQINALRQSFSRPALQSAAAALAGVDLPVTQNLKWGLIVGHAHITHYVDTYGASPRQPASLFVEGDATIPCAGLYCVPSGIAKRLHNADDITVIDEFDLTGFSLSEQPDDPNVTPIEILGGD